MAAYPNGSISTHAGHGTSSSLYCNEQGPLQFNRQQQPNRSISESSESELLPHVQKRSFRQNCCQVYWVICFLVVLSVVWCIALSICTTILFSQVGDLKGSIQKMERQTTDDRICQQCTELMVGPFDDDTPLLSELDRDGNLCCASTPKQTKIIMDMIYQRQRRISDINGNGKSNQSKCCNDTSYNTPTSGSISAHVLVGLQQLNAGQKRGSEPIRSWDHSDPTSHLDGLQLFNDKLVVPTPGLYLIYSQVCFSVRDRGNFEDGIIPLLYHYVYRYNFIYPNGGKQLLLKSVNAQRIEPSRDFGDLTSYTSAALMLNKGDQIYVQVSNLSYVSRDQKASFFGILKIKGG